MRQVEKAIAIPVRQMVRPAELAFGAAIIVAGLGAAAARLIALL